MTMTADEIEKAPESAAADRDRVWRMPPATIVFVPCSLDEVELVTDDDWQDAFVG